MRLALNFPRIDPTRGGAETYIVDLCRSLVQAGHQVDLYASSWAEGALPAEVRCIRVEADGSTRRRQIESFADNSAKALENSDYDCTVGFINTYEHDVIIPQGGVHRGSLQANSMRFSNAVVRRLYVLGKVLNPKYWAYREIERRQYAPQRQAHVIAVSHMVRRHIQEFEHVARSQIHVVPNAIDPDRVQVEQPGAVRCAFRNQLGLEPSDLVGLFVGHNYALKGLEPLIRSLGARNVEGARPIHLLVCGGGRTSFYRRLARRLGVGEFIHFLGFHDDVRECYWSSDFFVLPSYYDPCSLVVLEALACGLPVITSSCNGASELMTDGRQGYVLTSPDAQGELVSALDHMTDDHQRKLMAIEAQKLGREQTFDRHVSALLKVFQEVAATKARHGSHGRHSGSGPHAAKARSRKKVGRS